MSDLPAVPDGARTGRPTGAGYTVTMRVLAPHDPTLLPRLAEIVSDARGVVTGMDLVDVTTTGATVDLTMLALDEDHVDEVAAALETQAGVKVRHTSDPTFLYHLGGKIQVTARTQLRTRQDMSMAYTPGVARIASAIAVRPESAWTLTAKGTSVAIVTDGTAVLGLGNIGPLGALPVMEGKSLIFKEFGGVNAYPLCLNAKTPQAVIDATLAIAPGFGGINLEDIAAPGCFQVETELQRQLDIPVFHDDQHGTAVVVSAALRQRLPHHRADVPRRPRRSCRVRCSRDGDLLRAARRWRQRSHHLRQGRRAGRAARDAAASSRTRGQVEPARHHHDGRGTARCRRLHRHRSPRFGRSRPAAHDGAAADRLCAVKPRAGVVARRGSQGRAAGDRPLRHAEPDQQRALLSWASSAARSTHARPR